ncbi:hypothetical protein RFI_34608 [Reticulomyxa filosa]|uniref:Uncharacterized protein n=1 Tax=Reticulomyxa filosa TaxID=46433 RepID=X6LMH4_RETFI|nr:hypothetical protein RFI_34608 [Reticulomyxa filosa]|eukprot:ETO02809.1 hypothetical protein RFI_34608 [Reticulomyxa filosa]
MNTPSESTEDDKKATEPNHSDYVSDQNPSPVNAVASQDQHPILVRNSDTPLPLDLNPNPNPNPNPNSIAISISNPDPNPSPKHDHFRYLTPDQETNRQPKDLEKAVSNPHIVGKAATDPNHFLVRNTFCLWLYIFLLRLYCITIFFFFAFKGNQNIKQNVKTKTYPMRPRHQRILADSDDEPLTNLKVHSPAKTVDHSVKKPKKRNLSPTHTTDSTPDFPLKKLKKNNYVPKKNELTKGIFCCYYSFPHFYTYLACFANRSSAKKRKNKYLILTKTPVSKKTKQRNSMLRAYVEELNDFTDSVSDDSLADTIFP